MILHKAIQQEAEESPSSDESPGKGDRRGVNHLMYSHQVFQDVPSQGTDHAAKRASDLLVRLSTSLQCSKRIGEY